MEENIFQNWQCISKHGPSKLTYLGCKIPVHTGSTNNEPRNDEGQAEQREQTAASGTLAAVQRACLGVLAIKHHKQTQLVNKLSKCMTAVSYTLSCILCCTSLTDESTSEKKKIVKHQVKKLYLKQTQLQHSGKKKKGSKLYSCSVTTFCTPSMYILDMWSTFKTWP